MADIPATRVCTKCGEEKPLTREYWIPRKAYKHGLSSHCRTCTNRDERIRRRARHPIPVLVYDDSFPEMEWCDIPDYEGIYQVSSAGYIRRIDRETGNPLTGITPGRRNRGGYMTFTLKVKETPKFMMVHRIVMLAFVGEIPAGMVVNHKNGIRHDNRLENLEYCTQKENVEHSINVLRNFTIGENHGRSKLNDEKVRELRRLHTNGMRTIDIADFFGVDPATIHNVLIGYTWRHVTD